MMIRWRFILFLLPLLPIVACVEEHKESAEEEVVLNEWGVVYEPDLPIPDWMDKDSLKRQWTDTMVSSVITDTTEGRIRHVFYPKTFTPVDSIAYTIEEGKIKSIIARFTPPAQELLLEYYFEFGDLRYIRHREWNQRPENCGAREINFFLEKERLYFVRDRKTLLEIGEPPAKIAFHKLRPSQRTREELLQEIEPFWPMVLTLVEADLLTRE